MQRVAVFLSRINIPKPNRLLGLFTFSWEFPKIAGTLFWGPYNKDPTI